jgi:hypothetical protein
MRAIRQFIRRPTDHDAGMQVGSIGRYRLVDERVGGYDNRRLC